MFNKWRKFSYTAQKKQRSRVLMAVLWALSIFALYGLVSFLFFTTMVLQNETMKPGLEVSDRFVVLSFALPRTIPFLAGSGKALPFKRGSLVIVDRASGLVSGGRILRIADTFLRFFTAQRMGLIDREDQRYVKRVVAMPGDEVSMVDFILRIKSSGQSYALTEFELAPRPYDVAVPQIPAIWTDNLPFSGTMEPILLGADECFVVSDDRSNTNDSRTWGPIPVKSVTGMLVFRYWPPARLGAP